MIVRLKLIASIAAFAAGAGAVAVAVLYARSVLG
jgi:hypothetical protein